MMERSKPRRARGRWILLTGIGVILAWFLRDVFEREAPRPPILLVTIDTLRADHLGMDGYPRDTSPNLDRFARDEAVWFEDAVASSSWTFPTLASILTGASPSSHRGLKFHDVLSDAFRTLPESLNEAGYRTSAVITHVWLHPRYGLMQGVGDVDLELLQEAVTTRYGTVTSHAVTDRALAWLDEHRETYPRTPWFLWVHYFDPHFVYLPHAEDGIDFGAGEMDLYDAEIAYTDRHVGRLFDGLRERGLWDETLVCVVADHGEKFGEHTGRQHGDDLYRETIRVPFGLKVPGVAARRVRQVVRHVDFAPTIADLLELPLPIHTEGRSLRPVMEGAALEFLPGLSEVSLFPHASWTALTTEEWKLTIGPGDGLDALEGFQLFHRPSDPGETTNLAAQHPELTQELARTLEQMRSTSQARHPGGPSPARALSTPQEDEALRAIGY
ncbi:MAG: sulfatase [Planctomycetes bacterium]|nr:sulfatase [Planctomycetota bacterium]MCB9891917.1 sulfatase [Planctomycetota bacterium]